MVAGRRAKPDQTRPREPSDEDSDFAFAVDILTHWDPSTEDDAVVWRRMARKVRSLLFPSGFPVV